jgi:hypothetical protein
VGKQAPFWKNFPHGAAPQFFFLSELGVVVNFHAIKEKEELK